MLCCAVLCCAADFQLLYDPYSRSVCSSHDMMYKTRKTLLGHKSHLMENVCKANVQNIYDKDFMCVICKLLMFKILFLQTNLNNNIAPERNLCSTDIQYVLQTFCYFMTHIPEVSALVMIQYTRPERHYWDINHLLWKMFVRQMFRFLDDKDFMCVMCKLLMFKILLT